MTDKTRPPNRLGSAAAGVALELAPYAASIVAFIAGAAMLATAALPAFADRLTLLNQFAPLFVVEVSHFASSLIGLLLMLVGSALWRRRQGAFWLALFLLLAGAVFSLTRGLEYEEAALLLLAAGLLWSARRAFDRPSRLFSRSISSIWLIATVAAVASAGALGLFTYENLAYTDEMLWRFVNDGDASRFLRAGVVVAVLTLGVALSALFGGPRHRHRAPTRAQIDQVAEIIDSDPNAPCTARIALAGDKDFMFSESGRSVLAYRVRAGRWIALGAPYGPISEREGLMWRFVEEADRNGGTAVFYSAQPNLLPTLAAMGFIIRQIGELAIVDAANFTISGKGKQNLRTACNKAIAENWTFEVLPPGSAGPLSDELQAVSGPWLQSHAGAEKGFSMGRLDPAYLDRLPLAVARRDGEMLAFANLMTAGEEAGVDLMRYRPGAAHGAMDFLFVRMIEWARDNGYKEFSLGMAPLAGLQNRRLAPVFSRIGALVFTEAGALYSFGGLRAYKGKFGPQWRPLYMAGRPGTPMPLALLDVALLTGGGWRGLLAERG